MSRQSKMRRKAELAKQFKGNKGPAKTAKVHKKRNTWYGKLSSKAPVAANTPKPSEESNES